MLYKNTQQLYWADDDDALANLANAYKCLYDETRPILSTASALSMQQPPPPPPFTVGTATVAPRRRYVSVVPICRIVVVANVDCRSDVSFEDFFAKTSAEI